MRLQYHYRLLGFLVVFIFAFSANHLLQKRGKCEDNQPRPAAAQEAESTATAPAQSGTVLLEGPKTEPVKISAGKYPESLRAEDLYNASIPAVKTIITAQYNFFAEHQKYADNLAQLNLALAPSSQTEAERNTSIQSDFNITITADYIDVMHYSFPISQQENYALRFYNNGKISCLAKEAVAGNTCQTLAGGHHPDICLPNATKCAAIPQNPQAPIIRNITADYTEYALPNDFLARF